MHNHHTHEDAWPLSCPVCDSDLSDGDGVLVCGHGHSYDVAGEGYVNLLPPQHRTRRLEGDTAEMLKARRRFLDGDHYSPLRDALANRITELLAERTRSGASPQQRVCVGEVGCGDGYYVGGIADALPSELRPGITFVGTDLSKPAVRLAAKRYPDLRFFVANVHRKLYLRTGSVSVLLDVFSPRNPDEFARVIEPEGHLLVVIPSPSHLKSLRTALGLIGIQQDKEQRVLAQFADRFLLRGREEIEFSVELSPDAVTDLVQMGPNYWHLRSEGTGGNRKSVQAEASFILLWLQRDSSVHSGPAS